MDRQPSLEGVFDLDVISPEQGPSLLAAALRGSKEACVVLAVIDETIRRIHTQPPLCLCCPAAVSRIEGVTFGALSIEGEPFLGFVICPECDLHSAGDPRLIEAIQQYSPGARLLRITYPHGSRA